MKVNFENDKNIRIRIWMETHQNVTVVIVEYWIVGI